MKTQTILFACATFVLLMACTKKNGPDTTAPNISLNGGDSIYMLKGEMDQTPAATAIDDRDGNITANIVSNWDSIRNLNQIGKFTVRYQASDKANNTAIVTQIVYIDFTASLPLGAYTATLSQRPSCDMALPPGSTLTGTAIFTTTAIKDNFVVNFYTQGNTSAFASYTLIPKNNQLTSVDVMSYLGNLYESEGSAQIGANTSKVFYSSFSRQSSINCRSNDELSLVKTP